MSGRWALAGALIVLLSGCFAGPTGERPTDAASTGGSVFSDTAVFPGDYFVGVGAEGYSRVLVPGTLAILEPELVELKSPIDGAAVQIGVVRPAVPDGERVPVIALAGPYFFEVTPHALKDTFDWLRMVENFVPRGYAVAFVPIRGSGNNGGCMDFMGPAEQADLDTAITWLGEQAWSNGNVGMIGLSYAGATAWEMAARPNPHIKTIVPMAGVNDFFSLMFHNGTAEERGLSGSMVSTYWFYWWALEYQDRADDEGYGPMSGKSPEHAAQAVACPTALEAFAAAEAGASGLTREPAAFWDARDQRPGVLANYEGSIFVIQGLVDGNVEASHTWPWIQELEAKGLVVKTMLGQWEHRMPDRAVTDADLPYVRFDFVEILMHWFDRWLKEDTTQDLGPAVQVQDSSGRWRNEAEWPPARAAATEFWLTPGGKLDTTSGDTRASDPVTPTGERYSTWFVGGQDGSLPACAGCPTYSTPPFASEFRFAGIPQVHVTVIPTAPSQELAAWLYVVNGAQESLVGLGQIDVAYADGGQEPTPAVPGEPTLLRMVLEPLDVVVPAGASLRLELRGGDSTDHLSGIPPSVMTVEVGGEQSVLRLASFDVDPARFFQPPI